MGFWSCIRSNVQAGSALWKRCHEKCPDGSEDATVCQGTFLWEKESVLGNQWKLYCECCCFLFLQCHSSCTRCTLSPSLMTSRGPGCSFSLYQMRYPNRTTGAWHPHTLFPVSVRVGWDFFFPQKCIACWVKLVSINLLGCSLTFIFRVPNTTSGILLCCIVFRSRLLVSLMSVYLGLGSPLILVLGRNEPTWWMRIKQVFSSQLVAQLLANIVLL